MQVHLSRSVAFAIVVESWGTLVCKFVNAATLRKCATRLTAVSIANLPV